MMTILKGVGKGILYIIGMPFFMLVLALGALAGVFIIVFMFFKSIFLFFTGRSLDDELPEDRKAREIKERRKNPQPQVTPMVNSEQPLNDSPSIEEAVFGSYTTVISPTPTVNKDEPAPVVEQRVDNEPVVEEEVIEEEPEPVKPIVEKKPVRKDEEIGRYVPHTEKNRFIDIEEEEESSGVTISFGDDDE